MYLPRFPKEKGYTLIEVLVALTILAIIFSYGFASFREFARRQQVQGAVRSLRGELSLTQELAFAGKKPDHVNCNNSTLNGYNFKVVDSDTFDIEAVCSAGTVFVQTKDLSPGLSMTVPTPNPIFFRTLGQGTNITNSATITVGQVETSYFLDITINESGEIN